ncbi:TetR/AcrR family transcriptional regulator [uncultured Aureimonas sp.]|uniref:TetR/AcrR family transcriptional regulator n=1 Tax=uncultured Aureimonas sp. TaxID=1604662 RepID=UPI0025E4AA58|nr:TetR/AcrR family transcriptional regulator [uncultured Aureimonas sp.]
MASRTRGRPSPEEAQQLTDLILSIARRLFVEKGFEETSIDEICAIGKMSKKTLYARFGEKDGLFRATVGSVLGEFLSEARPRIVRNDGEDIEAYLNRIALDLIGSAIREDIVALDRLMVSMIPKFPNLMKTYEEARRSVADLIVPVVAEAQRRGELRAAEPQTVVDQFLAFVVTERMRAASFGLEPHHITESDRSITHERVVVFLCGYRPR